MDYNQERYVERFIDLKTLLGQKSYFLFGPRQTGKSSLLKHCFPNAKIYDLLDNALFLDLNSRPERLREEVAPSDKLVIIDEIQRVPQLLNEIHLLIEQRKVRFLLTGSSARKLRRGGVNLLGGRARQAYLHPFIFVELKKDFDLTKALNAGLIPSIYFSDNAGADLASYVGAYLKTEIAAEALTRDLPAFSRFLSVAALCNAKIVNFTNVANDAQIKRTTVYDYFDILKDTLILRELPAFKKGKQRKPICSSKYYFFDTGVARKLQGRSMLAAGTPEYGDAFETFMVNEAFAFSDYVRPLSLSFWRSTTNYEVDLIIDDKIAIELKAKTCISADDLKGLKAIEEEHTFKRLICVSLEKRLRKVGAVEIMPYQDFLRAFWDGALV